MSMSRRKRPSVSLSEILPGDTLHINVPTNRHLEAGIYTVTVDELCSSQVRYEKRFRCSFALGDEHSSILVHFRLGIPKHQDLISAVNYENPHKGCAFLGDDEFPVTYSHEPNLARRLRAGMNAETERLPYKD